MLAWAVASQASAQSVYNFRNLLIGGDFGTNPYQRGTAAVTGITTTGTYHADRWFAYTAASSAYLTRLTSGAGLPMGFGAAEQLARTAANASTSQICMAQIIENANAVPLQGQTMVLSYNAASAANFSGTGVQAIVTTGTVANETMASLIAGTWTGTANAVQPSGAAIPVQAITASAGRYSVAVVLPAAETEVAVQLCFNGVGTAGTTDGVIFSGVQFEVATPTGNPAVAPQPTAFERRPIGVELALAERYFYSLTDVAATVRIGGTSCSVTTANTTVLCQLPLPVPMRAVPTTAVSTATSFGIIVTAGTAGTCTTLAATASSNTVQTVGLTCTTAGTIALGSATPLIGAATAGTITASAEL